MPRVKTMQAQKADLNCAEAATRGINSLSVSKAVLSNKSEIYRMRFVLLDAYFSEYLNTL